MSGYAKTPLIKKLGFKPPLEVAVIDAPADYTAWLDPLPGDVVLIDRLPPAPKAVHLFTDRRTHLEAALIRLRDTLQPDGFVWVSWPKKASKVPTDITEDVIRQVALPLGLVDIKVCAVSEIWSGLKLMIRRSER